MKFIFFLMFISLSIFFAFSYFQEKANLKKVMSQNYKLHKQIIKNEKDLINSVISINKKIIRMEDQLFSSNENHKKTLEQQSEKQIELIDNIDNLIKTFSHSLKSN